MTRGRGIVAVIGGLRTRLPGWLHRDELRRRAAATAWLRWVPPHHLKDLVGARSTVPSVIAVTFDDGPDPQFTPPLLRVLARHDARATFFMCGLAAARHPAIVRAVVSEGHTVGAHGWDHRPVRSLTADEWDRQIMRPLEVLGELTGRQVRWFRPPWGAVDRTTVDTLRRRGVTTMLWSAEGLDWRLNDPADIVDTAERHLGPGGVVLLHDAAGDLLREDTASGTAVLPPGAHADRSATIAATDLLLQRTRVRSASIGLDDVPRAPLRRRTRIRVPAALHGR
jgi:peptidoglycan/xylan/chitin deacetylase (PgdA/CDA1 family)